MVTTEVVQARKGKQIFNRIQVNEVPMQRLSKEAAKRQHVSSRRTNTASMQPIISRAQNIENRLTTNKVQSSIVSIWLRYKRKSIAGQSATNVNVLLISTCIADTR